MIVPTPSITGRKKNQLVPRVSPPYEAVDFLKNASVPDTEHTRRFYAELAALEDQTTGPVLSGAEAHTSAGSIYMPAFGRSLSDAEVAAVANYVTARFGVKPSAVKAQDVAKMRQSQ